MLGGALNPLSGDRSRTSCVSGSCWLASQIRRTASTCPRSSSPPTPNTEGEATATYLVRMMRDIPGLTVSRLASGLPMGGDLEFADRVDAGVAHCPGRRELSRKRLMSGRRSKVSRSVVRPSRRGAQIIASAGKAFATRPYREITLKDIAERRRGVSASSHHQVLRSKRAVVRRVGRLPGRRAVTVFDAPERLARRAHGLAVHQAVGVVQAAVHELVFMSGVSEESNRKLRENYSTQMIDTLGRSPVRPRREIARGNWRCRWWSEWRSCAGRMMAGHATGTQDEVVALYAPAGAKAARRVKRRHNSC